MQVFHHLRNFSKYLIPTVIDPNKYYFADCLYKKVGRPRNEE